LLAGSQRLAIDALSAWLTQQKKKGSRSISQTLLIETKCRKQDLNLRGITTTKPST
jgi:hypothetical protein